MGNVFGVSEKAHVIKVDKAIVKIGGTTALALGVTIMYQRTVQQVPVLAEDEVLSIGKATGTFQAETILMKGGADVSESSLFSGDGCIPGTVTITFQDGSCSSQNKPITCKNCIASALTISARAGQGYVASGVTINFTAMSFS